MNEEVCACELKRQMTGCPVKGNAREADLREDQKPSDGVAREGLPRVDESSDTHKKTCQMSAHGRGVEEELDASVHRGGQPLTPRPPRAHGSCASRSW